MNSTTLEPNPIRRAISAMVYQIVTHLQRNARLRNQHAEKPLDGMAIEDLEAILVKNIPDLQPPAVPLLSGDFGMKGFEGTLTVTPEAIKACLNPEHPKRSSEIAAALGAHKEDVDAVIDAEDSGLTRGPGGWVKTLDK